jgi:hypothetical protein
MTTATATTAEERQAVFTAKIKEAGLTPTQLEDLADKWHDAAWGNVGITDDDLTLMGLTKQKTFKSKSGKTVKTDTWEGFCSFVYEKMTGEVHPGSNAMGRGFRSKAFGAPITDMLREAGADILASMDPDDLTIMLLDQGREIKELKKKLAVMEGRNEVSLKLANGEYDHNFGS